MNVLPQLPRRFKIHAAACLLLTCLVLTCLGWHFADAQTGVDALDDAAIAVKSPAAIPLVAITRVGPLLFASGLHGVIVFSRDSGATWHQAAVPVDVTLTSLYFASAQEGWAAGHFGVILHTTDGGLTWTRVVDGLDVIKDLNDVSAQAQSTAAGTPDAALKLRVATAYQNAGPSKAFLTIGPCGNGILAAGQQDLAMFSADGGKTWASWTANINDPTFLNIYAITDAGGLPVLIGEDGMMLKGDTNCLNFKTIPGPYTATLFGVIKKAPSDLLVYGIAGNAFLTTNLGASWNQVALNTDSVIDAGLLLNSGAMLLGSLDGNLYLSGVDIQKFAHISESVPFQIADMAVAPNGNLVVVGTGGAAVIPVGSIR